MAEQPHPQQSSKAEIERWECPIHGDSLAAPDKRLTPDNRWCHTCSAWIDAVEVGYIRAADVEQAVEALEAVLPLLHGDVLDSDAIAEIEVDVRAALYRLGHREQA